jgi:hypothetical protein
MSLDAGGIRLADPGRAEFDHSITDVSLRELATHSPLKVLQSSTPVPDRLWDLLNDRFFAERPDVELRIYGFYSHDCDLSFAPRMTNVRRFSADCLKTARNVQAIAEIPRLEALSIGIFEMDDLDVLQSVPATLTELSLGATRSRRISLAGLSRFRSLKRLYLEGHGRDVEVLSDLSALEDLTLRSIATSDLRYLAPLDKLWSLDIKLGGIKSLDGIEGKTSIKYLELWQVRDFRRIEVLALLPGLQNLFLQSLPHVQALPSLTCARALRRVVVENLKGLSDFHAFEDAPSLEEFALVDGKRQTPEQLVPVLRNRHLRAARAHFGSDRKNKAFAELRARYGKVEWSPRQDFNYR